MTADVIPFRKRRLPGDRWSADLRVWDGDEGVMGQVTDSDAREGETPGERLRRISDQLTIVARLLRDEAERIEPSEDGELLATVHVFRSSRVRLWRSVEMTSRKWLHKRLRDAMGMATKRFMRNET